MEDYWNEMPAPLDSEDLLAYGLRPPRCNGCRIAQLQHELGDKFLMLDGVVYELDAEPAPGQGELTSHEGRPIRWRSWFMGTGHSDECYNWQPLDKDY